MKRSRGFSLMEIVVAVALLGLMILIVTMLERERREFERTSRLEWMKHPEPLEVLGRLRRDVLDASKEYPASYESYAQSPEMLILSGVGEDGKPATIVWDFSKEGMTTRLEFRAGAKEPSLTWTARAVPKFTVSSYSIDPSDPNAAVGVRLTGRDEKGVTLIDEIVFPRVDS